MTLRENTLYVLDIDLRKVMQPSVGNMKLHYQHRFNKIAVI
jgi:hypothetical protein